MAQDPLNLLCVEPRFPGRLGAVADWLVRKRGYRAWFYCHLVGPADQWPASTGRGLEVVQHPVGGVAREPSVAWTRHLERGLCYAYGAWEALEARRPRPVDVVLGRSADLGSTLFVPPFAPRVPIVQMFDYFYHPHRHDLADELGPSMPPDYFHWRRAANAMDLLDLENGVIPWATSAWQHDLYPAEYRADFRIIDDGVDRDFWSSLDEGRKSGRTVAGRSIPDSTFVITFIASELDRLRGFDRFLTLANGLMRAGVDAVALAVGAREVRRALDIPHFGRDYAAERLAADPPPDPDRIWLLGEAAPSVVREALSASDLHCYPSRPYPASRSLKEALASGRPILAWKAEPINDLIGDWRDHPPGLLCEPGDPADALECALRVHRDADLSLALRDGARGAGTACDRDVTLPKLAELLDGLAKGRGA